MAISVSVAPISNLPLHQNCANHLFDLHCERESEIVRLNLGNGSSKTFVVKTGFEIINWWVIDNESGEQVEADFYPEKEQLTIIFSVPPTVGKYKLILIKK
jgi:hypothetical protein